MTTAHHSKPTHGTRMNMTHPLAKGCVGAWLFNEGNGVTLKDSANFNDGSLVLSGTNSPIWGSNRYGTCLRTTDVNQYALLARVDRLFNKSAGETVNNFSIVYCFQKFILTTDGWNFGVRSTNALINQSFGAQIPNSGGDVIWMVGGSDADVNIQNANNGTFPTMDLDIWVFTNSFNRGMEIWQNGKLISYGLNKNPSFTITTNNLAIGDVVTDSGTGVNAADLADHNFLYVYDRALTSEEIQAITITPYSMYQSYAIPIVLQVGEEGVYYTRGLGGIEAGGRGSFTWDETASGGIAGGGIGHVFSYPVAIEASGGLEAAGEGLALRTKVEIASGGIEAAGLTVLGIGFNGDGGANLAGTAPLTFIDEVDGTGGISGGGVAGLEVLYLSPASHAGSVGGGTGLLVEYLRFHGGIETGGAGNLLPGPTSAIATGGARPGGTASVGWYIQQRILSFAVEVGGRAINIRRGNPRNIHIGYALAMQNENIIKTALAASLEPVKIIIPQDQIIDNVEESEFRYQPSAEWCYIEDCKDNVLPRIVENRQGIYLPPKTREARLAAASSQITQLEGF